MCVKLVFVARLHDGGVAARPRQRNLHRLVEQREALHLLDGRQGRLGLVEDHKGLALGLEVRLGHNVDHAAIFREDGAQRLLERLWLDALLEVAHVDPAKRGLVPAFALIPWVPCMCRSAMTHT